MKGLLHGNFFAGRGRLIAVVAAAILVGIGLVMAVLNEDAYKQQKMREISVQAQIVSASVAPALMFDNSSNAQEYLRALAANPDIETAAVYGAGGERFAQFSRGGNPAPLMSPVPSSPHVQGASVVVVARVVRDGESLGAVYLRTDTESALRRIVRYAGISVLILLAALVLTVFGLSQGALAEANANLSERARQLQQEIEQREKAEEELLQSRKLEAIGQLTGGVAHDFNNLLTVVLSGLRLMERNPDPARRTATMEAMRQAVERGVGLTRQLLAFSRRETLKLEAIDAGLCLQAMRPLLERSLRADILVDINAAPDLWPVKTDPTQFELAIINLAVNARDAMPKGGVLTVSAQNKVIDGRDLVEIAVRDTGVGMSPDILKRVFEPYFTTKQAGQGTGLGLSQVYGVTVQSGGSSHIESALNAGTTVRLLLPRTQDAIAQAPLPAPATPLHAAGRSVLVVEDDDGVATMVGQMLQQMGCQPKRVANAAAALDILEHGCSYDLIFSDIVMPGAMDGVELANEIHRRYPQTPIVLTTGFSGSAKVSQTFPILRKPYQMEELESILAQALAH
ncbi:MAG: ATP-binding protein [Vitreimonas sp.]